MGQISPGCEPRVHDNKKRRTLKGFDTSRNISWPYCPIFPGSRFMLRRQEETLQVSWFAQFSGFFISRDIEEINNLDFSYLPRLRVWQDSIRGGER